MSVQNHISQDDLYLFGLQLLAEEEMASSHDHMLTCDDCRRQLAWVQGDLAAYAMTSESTPVPAGAKERLMRSIAKDKRLRAGEAEPVVAVAEPAKVAAPEPVVAPRDNVFSFEDAPVKRKMGVAGWAGWAIAATAIAAGGVNWQHSQQQLTESRAEVAQLNDEVTKSGAEATKANMVMQTMMDMTAKQVSLALPNSAKPKALPEGHASYLGSKGSLVFIGRNITPLDGAKTYELWLIPTGKDAKPIPAGTFKPDSQGRVNLMMASLPTDVEVAAMGVTVEPDGGSEKPTMPIVLMGE